MWIKDPTSPYHTTMTHFVECKLSGLRYIEIEIVTEDCENYEADKDD